VVVPGVAHRSARSPASSRTRASSPTSSEEQDGPATVLRLQLKYVDGKVPGRLRAQADQQAGPARLRGQDGHPACLGGLGIVIVSTSQGIMTGQQARKAQLGGEVLAFVW
jgi:small subunit ribosomal protein S8